MTDNVMMRQPLKLQPLEIEGTRPDYYIEINKSFKNYPKEDLAHFIKCWAHAAHELLNRDLDKASVDVKANGRSVKLSFETLEDCSRFADLMKNRGSLLDVRAKRIMDVQAGLVRHERIEKLINKLSPSRQKSLANAAPKQASTLDQG